MSPQQTPPRRPEREVELAETAAIGDVERPLTLYERITNSDAVQRLTIQRSKRPTSVQLCPPPGTTKPTAC